jgi:hypothetical protein
MVGLELLGGGCDDVWPAGLLAVVFFVAPGVDAATTAARTATRQSAAMLRLFIWIPPASGGPASTRVGAALW